MGRAAPTQEHIQFHIFLAANQGERTGPARGPADVLPQLTSRQAPELAQE
jgi:hypothetical protein